MFSLYVQKSGFVLNLSVEEEEANVVSVISVLNVSVTVMLFGKPEVTRGKRIHELYKTWV